MEVALFEPRIPQNTGNIARSCAAFNLPLNLIEPLGFKIEDKYLRRAGLDYWPLVTVNQYSNFEKFLESKPTKRIISFSKKNDKSDFLISIFMPNLQTGSNDHKGVRSLNLSVACGIAIYEAHKQINFQNCN